MKENIELNDDTHKLAVELAYKIFGPIKPKKEGMKTYKVYGMMTASVLVGEYVAESEAEALDMADGDREANWNPSLCHQCNDEIELGEIYDTQVEEVR